MNAPSDEVEILETILLNDSSMKDTQIASESNKELAVTIMHLTELTHRGCINSPRKGLYTLTDAGKKVLGIHPVTKENAKSIITYVPHDKAFNFHVNHDTPLHMHAHSLQDFVNKLVKIDLKTIEFHMDKGDFEAWFKCLGDQELAKKTAIIKERKIIGEQRRLLLQNIIEQRYQALMKLTEQITP